VRKTLLVAVAAIIFGCGTLLLLRHHENRTEFKPIPQSNTKSEETQSIPVATVSDPSTVERALKDNKNYYRSASLFAENIDQHLDIEVRGKKYRIEFDQLPVTKEDCANYSNSKSCVRSVGVVAFDEARGRVLLDVPTDTWKNVPMVMVGYELSTGAFTRYGMTGGIELQEGIASPSGHYFAFVSLGTAGGSCGISGRVSVVDTQLKKMVQLEAPSFPGIDMIQMGRMQWIGDSELSYESTAFKSDDCIANPESYKTQGTTTRVKLADLTFPEQD
jgi:hypothetical protein